VNLRGSAERDKEKKKGVPPPERPLVFIMEAGNLPAIVTEIALAASAAEIAAGPLFARPGFVDGQGPTLQVLAVLFGNGLIGLVLAAHFHESESAGLVGELVHDQIAAYHISHLGEQIQDIPLGGLERQVSDIQFSTHLWFPFAERNRSLQ
jgi:hypothetical protein